MKKLFKFSLLLMAILFALNANAKIEKSDILGTWTQSVNEEGISVTTTYDFKEDNTVTQIFIMNGASPKMNVIADGTAQYTLNDDSITFKFSGSDFNFTVFEIEGIPQEYVGLAQEQMRSSLVNVEQTLSDIKINGNTLTAKFNGETVTLERK